MYGMHAFNQSPTHPPTQHFYLNVYYAVCLVLGCTGFTKIQQTNMAPVLTGLTFRWCRRH